MATKIEEKNILIARRVPPGDKWRLVANEPDGPVHKTLTDALEAHFKASGNPCEFRLSPLDSKLYAIETNQYEITEEEPKEFSMYGEFKQGA